MKKFFVPLVFLAACSAKMYRPTTLAFTDYRITAATPADTALSNLMKGYADSVNFTMNSVIGTAAKTLNKARPEGTLGNFMADAMLVMARKKYSQPVDAAAVNYGGIRLEQLPQGPITTGKIFELMPFDNLIVVLPVPGDSLQSFLDHVARKGGWPIAGITYTIQNNRATNVLVAGLPIQPTRTYNLAISDYVANGGDDCYMLKTLPQLNMGYVLRDALVGYVKLITAEGKPIDARLDGRVKNATATDSLP